MNSTTFPSAHCFFHSTALHMTPLSLMATTQNATFEIVGLILAYMVQPSIVAVDESAARCVSMVICFQSMHYATLFVDYAILVFPLQNRTPGGRLMVFNGLGDQGFVFIWGWFIIGIFPYHVILLGLLPNQIVCSCQDSFSWVQVWHESMWSDGSVDAKDFTCQLCVGFSRISQHTLLSGIHMVSCHASFPSGQLHNGAPSKHRQEPTFHGVGPNVQTCGSLMVDLRYKTREVIQGLWWSHRPFNPITHSARKTRQEEVINLIRYSLLLTCFKPGLTPIFSRNAGTDAHIRHQPGLGLFCHRGFRTKAFTYKDHFIFCSVDLHLL